MAVLSIDSPFTQIIDVDGDPLKAGYVYVGEAGLDAETNPISVFWDEALTIPAVQPVRTLNGYYSRSGSPGNLFSSGGDFSIKIKNKNQTVVYSALSQEKILADFTKSQPFSLLEDLESAKWLKVGQKYKVLGRYVVGDEGANEYEIVAAGTGTADGGEFLDLPGSGLQAKALFPGDVVHVMQFGAKPNDRGFDNQPYWINAINYCKQRNIPLFFFTLKEKADYSFLNEIDLTDFPIALIGDISGVWQAGSTRPNVTLSWVGGSSYMMSDAVGNNSFYGFAVQNIGNGISKAFTWLKLEPGSIRNRYERLSFLLGSGALPFTSNIIKSNGNRVGYSSFKGIQVGSGVAPVFLDIDGQGSPNGITPFTFSDRCIFESGSGAPLTVVKVKDETLDQLFITECTFNQQGGELCAIDTTDTPLSTSIREFIFKNNEWDYSIASGTPSTDRFMRLTNVDNAVIDDSDWQMGGAPDHCIELVNTNLASFKGNGGRAVTVSVINADSSSVVNAGLNSFDISNVPRLVNDDSQGQVLYLPWVAGNVFIVGEKVAHNVNTTQVIEPTSGAGWTLTFRHGSQGYFVPGQLVTVEVRNTSGGAISAGTPAAAIKTAGALVAPADGFSRFYTFEFDGTGFREISRSAADVPV